MRLSFLKRLTLIALSITTFLPIHLAGACSRIFWNSNGKAMLVARNMDLAISDVPALYVLPVGMSKIGGDIENPAQWTSRYGSVVAAFWAFMEGHNICTEGINTQGLAFHYLVLFDSTYENRNLNRPGVEGGLYGQYLLDNAATVTEALALMSQTQVVPDVISDILPCHLALEDATGDSAIVEFIGGQMIVYHDSNYTILTNDPPYNDQLNNLKNYKKFGGNLPWPGEVDPMSRFVRASAFLTTLNVQPFLHPNLISSLFSAIRSVETPFGADMGPTLWSSVFDLSNKAIYFTHKIAKNNFWINLGKLNFSPGAPVLYLEANKPGLFGEVSSLMSPVSR
jgi:penicillin V acylase-like amidase (Ntn superfamily)